MQLAKPFELGRVEVGLDRPEPAHLPPLASRGLDLRGGPVETRRDGRAFGDPAEHCGLLSFLEGWIHEREQSRVFAVEVGLKEEAVLENRVGRVE